MDAASPWYDDTLEGAFPMCMEDSGHDKVCLIRPSRRGGGAYCNGNVCFGMGARGTHDPKRATCGRCLRDYHENQRRMAQRSVVDQLADLAEDLDWMEVA